MIMIVLQNFNLESNIAAIEQKPNKHLATCNASLSFCHSMGESSSALEHEPHLLQKVYSCNYCILGVNDKKSSSFWLIKVVFDLSSSNSIYIRKEALQILTQVTSFF